MGWTNFPDQMSHPCTFSLKKTNNENAKYEDDEYGGWTSFPDWVSHPCTSSLTNKTNNENGKYDDDKWWIWAGQKQLMMNMESMGMINHEYELDNNKKLWKYKICGWNMMNMGWTNFPDGVSHPCTFFFEKQARKPQSYASLKLFPLTYWQGWGAELLASFQLQEYQIWWDWGWIN